MWDSIAFCNMDRKYLQLLPAGSSKGETGKHVVNVWTWVEGGSAVMDIFPPSACCDTGSRPRGNSGALPRSVSSNCTEATGKDAIATICIANSYKPQIGFSSTNMVSQGKVSKFSNEHFLGLEFCHFVEAYAAEGETKGSPPALLHCFLPRANYHLHIAVV